eukprot:jgi/Mesvir1/14429/Mv05159-RA.1
MESADGDGRIGYNPRLSKRRDYYCGNRSASDRRNSAYYRGKRDGGDDTCRQETRLYGIKQTRDPKLLKIAELLPRMSELPDHDPRSKGEFFCGTDVLGARKGRDLGSFRDCARKRQVRMYGLYAVGDLGHGRPKSNERLYRAPRRARVKNALSPLAKELADMFPITPAQERALVSESEMLSMDPHELNRDANGLPAIGALEPSNENGLPAVDNGNSGDFFLAQGDLGFLGGNWGPDAVDALEPSNENAWDLASIIQEIKRLQVTDNWTEEQWDEAIENFRHRVGAYSRRRETSVASAPSRPRKRAEAIVRPAKSTRRVPSNKSRKSANAKKTRKVSPTPATKTRAKKTRTMSASASRRKPAENIRR